MVVNTLGAVCGRGSVHTRDLVGIELYYLDHGVSSERLMPLAIDVG